MTGRLTAKVFLFAVLILPVLACQASAQECNSLNLGTFHSPKGIGLCLDVQQESTSFDSFNVLCDLFGILRGEYSRPGVKATYYRGIILKHRDRGDFSSELYAGPGVTAGYVRDIHEPLSLVAGMAGVAGYRMYFNGKRLTISLESGIDLALELNRNNRYKKTDLKLYQAGIFHVFYPQVRILYKIK